MQAYSKDLRIRVLRACESGMTVRKVSEAYKVSEIFIYRLKRLKKETGQIEAKKQGGYKKIKLLSQAEELKKIVKATPDITLEELQETLNADGKKPSISTLWRMLDRLGLSYKKNTTRRGAGQARRKRAARRVAKTTEKP